MKQNDSKLTIVTIESPNSKMRGKLNDHTRQLIEKGIPLDKLRESLTSFLSSLQHVFTDPGPSQVGGFALDEVTFSAEIGADGEFKLLGTGVGVSAKSGVRFILRRQQS